MEKLEKTKNEPQKEVKRLKRRIETYKISIDKNYIAFASQLQQGIIVYQKDKIVFANPKAVNLLGGKDEDEILGKTLFKFVQSDYKEIVSEKIADIQNDINFTVSNIEVVFLTISGKAFFVQLSGSAVRLENDSAIQFEFYDITDRKEEIEKTKAQHRQLISIFESISDIVYVSDPDTYEILYANKVLKDAFKKNLVGETCYKALQNLNEPCSFCTNKIIFENKSLPYNWEYFNPIVKKHYKITDRTIKWTNGKDVRLEFARDITEEKEKQKALEKSEERFRTVFSTSPDSMNIHRLSDGKYVEVNDGFTKMTGYSKEETIGKTSDELGIWVNPKDKIRLLDELNNHGAISNFRAKFRTKDGSVIYGILSGNKIEIDSEKYFISVSKDITQSVMLENQLREREQFLNSIMNAPKGVIIFSLDNEYRYTFFSKLHKIVMKQIWSVDIEIGGNMLDYILNEKDKERAKRNFDRALNGEHFLVEEEYGDDKNRTFWEDHYSPILNNKNIPVGISVFVFDITKRKKDELEILKLSNAIEQSLASVVITDIKGNIEYVNKHFTEVTGYTKKEAIGENPRILKTDFYSPQVYKELWRTISQNKTWKGEFYNRKKNGEFYWEKAVISPITNKDGKIVNYVAIKEDITEWKEATEELLFLEKIVKASVNEIYIFDKETFQFKFFNDSALKNTGYKFDEITSLSLADLVDNFSEQNTREILNSILRETSSGNRIETVIVRKNGSTYPVEVSVQYVKHDKTERLVAIAIDITKRKEAEKEIKEHHKYLESKIEERTEEISLINESLQKEVRKKEEAEERLKVALGKEKELNKIKDQFMSTISHDLRTPLTAIQSSVDLMEKYYDKWDKERVLRKYSQIKSSVTRISEMLLHVLELSKIERGKAELSFKDVDLFENLNNIIDEIEHLKKEKHFLNLDFKIKEKVHKVDITLIREILINLLSNGLKYSPEGGKVELVADEDESNFYFSVSDEGIGIAENEIEQIFDEFYRSEESQNISGSGLGLSIVKNYVEMYKGKIEVTSQQEKGTIVKVTLPKIIKS